MKKTYPVYVILTLAVFASAAFMAGSNFNVFLDLPSMAIVFVPLIFMLLTVYTPSEMADAFRSAMKGKKATEDDLEKACLFFEGAQQMIYRIALTATLFGVILILSSISRPEELGRGFAVAILTVFYALVAGFLVIVPFKTAVKKRLLEKRDQQF